MVAALKQPYSTTSSWPPSPGHCVKLSSFIFFWWKCLEQMTESGSTSIWHWDGVRFGCYSATTSVRIASTSCSERLFLQSLTLLFCSCLVHELANFHWFHQEMLILWFSAFCSHPSVLPIPVVVITGGARHDYYLIRASFDQSHPHYNSIKA